MIKGTDRNNVYVSGAEAAASLAVEKARRDLAEVTMKKKVKLVKLAAMMLAISVVLVFATRSWFTMSREIMGTGARMTSENMPFEIATVAGSESGVRYEQVLSSVKSELSDGDPFTSDGTDYKISSASNSSLKLRYITGDSEIGPGGRGKVELFLIPKEDMDVRAEVTTEVRSYAEFNMYVYDDSGNIIMDQTLNENNESVTVPRTERKLMDIETVTADKCTLTEAQLNEFKESAEYIKGHIMFFGGLGEKKSPELSDDDPASWEYFFTDPLTEPEHLFEFRQDSAIKNNAYPISIYWMWPKTIGQIVMKKDTSTLLDETPIVQDLPDEQTSGENGGTLSDKEKVIQYVKDNKSIILKDWSSVPTADELAALTGDADASDFVDDMIENAGTSDNCTRLSVCYNSADSCIGTDIMYFVIEVTVKNKS